MHIICKHWHNGKICPLLLLRPPPPPVLSLQLILRTGFSWECLLRCGAVCCSQRVWVHESESPARWDSDSRIAIYWLQNTATCSKWHSQNLCLGDDSDPRTDTILCPPVLLPAPLSRFVVRALLRPLSPPSALGWDSGSRQGNPKVPR